MGIDGDEQNQALRELIRAHGGAVRTLIARQEYNLDEIDDLTSDVFRLAYRNLSALQDGSPAQVRTWLLITARNLVANHVRRAINRRRLIDRLAHQRVVPAASVDDVYVDEQAQIVARARDERVRRLLDSMREDYRLVLVMDALGDPDRKIARALGVSPNAARKRLQRARLAFRALYLEEMDSLEGPFRE